MSEERRPSSIRAYPSVNAGKSSEKPREDWELFLTGDLSEQQSDLMGKLVEVPRRSRGTIFIDSSGGSVFTGLALASIIRLRGLDPVVVVAGECSSSAIMPFAACQRRYVTPHSTLLFHPMRWQSEEDVRLEEAAEWARYFRILEEDVDKLLSRMFPCELSLLENWTRPGRFIRGTELVEAGLARMVDLFQGDVWGQISQSKAA